MLVLARFCSLPVVRDALARTSFWAVADVDLADWNELDEATCWCAAHWVERGLHYRRYADPDVCNASFEFADERHAVDFKLRFG